MNRPYQIRSHVSGHIARLVLVTVLSSLVTPQVLALASGSGLGALRLPIGARVSWVGRNIQHNGLVLDIQVFRSSRNVAGVLDFYREVWAVNATDNAPGYQEQSIGGWSVISTVVNENAIVLQIRPGLDEATEGFFSALNTSRSGMGKPPLVSTLPHDIPLPAGSDLLSRTVSGDVVKHGVTLIVENSATVSQNTRFFRDQMERTGWQLSTSTAHVEQAVLMFEKVDGYCEISISTLASGKTLLLINRVSHEA